MRGALASLLAACPFRTLLAASCIVFLLVACTSQPLTVTRDPATLRLVAADSCKPLAEELADAYEKAHPWVEIQIEVFNSSVAEQVLRAGEADVALLSWLREDVEGEALWSQPFSRDGIAIIVHPATPFSETGLAHLQAIFRGRVQEWGGMVLTAVSREHGSGTRAAFESTVLGDYDVALTSVVMPSSEAVIEHAGRTPGAVGYVSTLWLSAPAAENVRVAPVEGTLPTTDAISDGRYILSRPLHIATIGDPTDVAREFAQWVLGPEGQAVAVKVEN